MRVKIKKLPTAQSGLEVKMKGLKSGLGLNSNMTPWGAVVGKMSQPSIKVNGTLQPVPRNQANLEAEKGEEAMLPTESGIPDKFTIAGKRHYDGGTPLNLPPDSFIFSDTNSMKVKDPELLKHFGMSAKKGGFTPASISKKFDINDYKKTLADPDTDDLQKKTAEAMISKYNIKLAKLGLIQESMKGFPQGIPKVAMPYIETMNMDPAQFAASSPQPGDAQNTSDNQTAKYGGNLPKAQNGTSWGGMLLNAFEAPQRTMMYLGTGALNAVEGHGWQGKYEMPGTVLKQNYPDAPSWLTTATDVLADPFLISGVGKSIARSAVKAFSEVGIKESAEMVSKGLTKEAVTKDVVLAALEKAAKPTTNFNYSVMEHALNTGIEHGHQAISDAGRDLSKSEIENEIKNKVIRATGRAGQVETIKAGSENVVKAGQYVGEKLGQATTYIGEKVPEVAKTVYEGGKKVINKGIKAIDNPYVLPVAAPALGNVRSSISRNMLQDKLSDANKTIEQLQQQTQQPQQLHTLNNPYKIVYSADGKNVMGYKDTRRPDVWITEQEYTNATNPNPKSTFAQTKQVVERPITVPVQNTVPQQVQQQTPDTIRNLSQEDQNKLLGLPQQKLGGALPQAKLGMTLSSDGKYYFDDGNGKVTEIDPDIAKRYIASHSATSSEPIYDVYDKGIAKGIKESKYDFVYPQKDLQHKEQTVGSQHNFDPESGFYYTTIKPGQTGLNDFINRHKEIIDNYKGASGTGVDAWKKDHLAAAGKENPADTYVIDENNKRYREITGEDLVKDNPDKYKPGVEIFNMPGLKTPSTPKTDVAKTETKTPGDTQIKADHINPGQAANPNAPWWLQDIIKTTNAAGDYMGIKKYMPWEAKPSVYTPNVLFADPTRELAANSEQSNIAGQNLAQFTGPQAFNARFNEIQGHGAQNAADILGRYNNMNINTSNQQEVQNAATMNRASEVGAKRATDLYDKYTIANQSFDNSKRQAKDAMVNQFVQGITNANYTANLNDLNPQYAINPSVGGRDYFKNPRALDGKTSEQPSVMDYYKKIMESDENLRAHPDKVLDAALKMSGYGTIEDRKAALQNSSNGVQMYPGDQRF